MNKKQLIFDILFTFILSIVILFSSFFISSFISSNEAERKLEDYSQRIVTQLQKGASFSEIQNSYQSVLELRITILDETGKPMLEINELDKEPAEEDRLFELKSHIQDFYYKKSKTMGYEILYYVDFIDDFYIRVGFPKASILQYSLPILIYGTIALTCTNIIYATIKIINYKNNLKKLNLEVNNLKRISGEENIENFNDVDSLLDAFKTNEKLIENKIEELQFQKDKTTFILDSIKEGFITIDENKTIRSINNYAVEVLKLDKSVIDKNSVFLSLGKIFDDELNKALQKNKYQFELDFSGKMYQFFANTIQLNWKDRTEKGLALLFFDITENKMNEKIKKEFFQNASHELKTPLTTIIGYEGIITNHLIPENEISEANQAILKEANRMKNIIDDMLTLANLENFEETNDFTSIQVKNVIDDILDEIQCLINQKNIQVTVDADDTTILASIDDVERLIKNLLTNAVKYNKEEGEIHITLKDNTLTIQDTGIGIDKQHISRIFERFYRVDKGRSRAQGGTGLGLAIVKHICMKYGYSLGVTSEIDIGSSFTISFD